MIIKDLQNLEARGFGYQAFLTKKYAILKRYGVIPMDDERPKDD
jgi:hypothetical protein